MDIIDKSALYGNKYNAVALCEYPRELKLIKRFIDIAEEAVKKKKNCYTWSFEGVCYYFAKTIVDYSKMAYDNIILGHFQATNMTIRAIVENCVLLDIVISHNDEELWKYYIVYSYRETIYKCDRKPSQKEIDFLNKMYVDFGINEEFYLKQDKKKPFIERKYGWTYKIDKSFTFAGLSKFVNDTEHHTFKMMSDYSHSTSFYTKFESSIFVEKMMYMFTNLYIELYQMIMLYCVDTVDDSFYDVSEDIENIMYNFIEYEESWRKEAEYKGEGL